MKKRILVFLLFAIILFSQHLDPKLEKWINIGSLQTKFMAAGAERAWNGLKYEGMCWPAMYAHSDNHVIDRQWLVCKNFNADDSTHYDYLGIYFGSSLDPNYGYPVKLEQSAKFNNPEIIINNVAQNITNNVDTLHSATVSYERKLINVFNSYLGVEFKRTVYAYSQQYHDNYFITEYILKNTGNIDDDDEIELPENSIEGLLFAMMPRYATSSEAKFITSSQMAWGKHQWISFMDNYDVNPYNPDSLRCFWTWLGQSSDIPSTWDQIGAPDGGNGTLFGSDSGRLTSPQFAGMAVIHADRSAMDKRNDPAQPLTLAWHGGDSYPSILNKNESASEDLYKMLTWESLYSGNYGGYGDDEPMVGSNPLRKPYGNEKPQLIPGNEPGGPAALITFGPYDLPHIGDSIRIVLVEAVNGLCRKKCIKVGENWLAGTDLILPDGSSASNRDQYKNEWFYTGRDSLFQTFKRATVAYRHNLTIPDPPLPPLSFTVTSQTQSVDLAWTASPSESEINFGGYRVYRAEGSQTAFYELIFSCNVADDIYEYTDRTTRGGVEYYYYIVSYTDGTLNNSPELNPIGELISSPLYTKTLTPVVPYHIDVIPPEVGDGSETNPYEISSINNLYWLSLNPEETDKHFVQTRDISLYETTTFSNTGWETIYQFSGVYDGQGHMLDSLRINNPSKNYCGLFGKINGGTILDLHLRNVDIIGGEYSGAFAGRAMNNAQLTRCSVQGSIAGKNFTGAIVGENNLSGIENCYSTGSVSGNEKVGGICGYNASSDLSNSYSRCSISAVNRVGGLVGHDVRSNVDNCYSTGRVEASSNMGGLVGFSFNSDYSSCFWDTQTSEQATSTEGTAKTTSEMKLESTYTDSGWNFTDTWLIDLKCNEGYPILKWELANTGIENETIPSVTYLHQNYPNPFNPRTEISYQLTTDGNIDLSIFNINGKKVHTLINGYQKRGYHKISWDAGDIPSGIYLYRLQAGGFIETRKLILMK